jgi:glycosyltransferase involved in cell wall biosynthesis
MVPNGVTVPERLKHISSNGELRLLYFGRLDPIKGLENLFEACAMARRECGVRLHLTIAGDGERRYVSVLRRQITNLGIASIVSMHGWADNGQKRSLFEQTDVVVVPSYKESFAIVVAEALSCGIPVVASRGTPWRQMEEVGCGLCVANDPKSLAGAIDRVSRMPLREMGERGRDWMEREFNWARIAARMVDVYLRLQGEGGDGQAQGGGERE